MTSLTKIKILPGLLVLLLVVLLLVLVEVIVYELAHLLLPLPNVRPLCHLFLLFFIVPSSLTALSFLVLLLVFLQCDAAQRARVGSSAPSKTSAFTIGGIFFISPRAQYASMSIIRTYAIFFVLHLDLFIKHKFFVQSSVLGFVLEFRHRSTARGFLFDQGPLREALRARFVKKVS